MVRTLKNLTDCIERRVIITFNWFIWKYNEFAVSIEHLSGTVEQSLCLFQRTSSNTFNILWLKSINCIYIV